MCIRDRFYSQALFYPLFGPVEWAARLPALLASLLLIPLAGCLLYTSDAADERSSVDLGGRRILKKKNTAVARWVYCLSITSNNSVRK